MTRIILCYECGGKGWYTKTEDTRARAVTCEHCNGKGVIEIPHRPLSNFEHIHRMTQEEFVKWFVSLDSICECCSRCGDEDCGAEYCEEELNKFLSQEYNGGF